jgi:hypothetical protein
MAEFLFLVLFVGSMIGFMVIAYRRMIGIRDGTQSRLDTDPDPVPTVTPYVEEIRGEDGLVYAKEMNFSTNLSSADKRAAKMPDVNQTLQGKR